MDAPALNEPTHLDLFSGIGGFALAAQWAGFRTIGFCEIDKYCQKVLAKNFLGYPTECKDWRLQQSRFPANTRAGSPIFADIFALDGTQFRGVDLITGGFPCQPFSVAGKRRGKEDDRAIWPEMLRIIKEARPAWVLGENVPGIITMELDNVLSDLEAIGYATRAFTVPACAIDARHRRDRVWIIAHSERRGLQERWTESVAGMEGCGSHRKTTKGKLSTTPESDYVAKSNAKRCGRRQNNERQASTERNGNQAAGDAANANESRSQRRNSASVCECAGEWIARQSDSSVPDSGRGSTARHERSQRTISECCEQKPQSEFCRVVDGLSEGLDGYCQWPEEDQETPRVAVGIQNRVDRLKGLGNAIVSQVAYEILREIRKLI